MQGGDVKLLLGTFLAGVFYTVSARICKLDFVSFFAVFVLIVGGFAIQLKAIEDL